MIEAHHIVSTRLLTVIFCEEFKHSEIRYIWLLSNLLNLFLYQILILLVSQPNDLTSSLREHFYHSLVCLIFILLIYPWFFAKPCTDHLLISLFIFQNQSLQLDFLRKILPNYHYLVKTKKTS